MVDSPSPAAAYTYAARQRDDADRASRARSSARPTVMGLPEMLASTVAPASAASALAMGLGAQARPEPTTLQALVTAVAEPLGADVQFR